MVGKSSPLPAFDPKTGAGGVSDFLTTRVETMVSWARSNSLWPLPFATACCGIEFMSVVSSHYDLSRFGAEVVRFSPRQADLLIVAGPGRGQPPPPPPRDFGPSPGAQRGTLQGRSAAPRGAFCALP